MYRGSSPHRLQANQTFFKLVEEGLPRDRLRIFEPDSAPPDHATKSDNNAVLTDVLVDGAFGTVVGTGIGALAELALVAANVSLFVASPLIAPLAMLGWGASLGGFIGAAAGTVRNSGTTRVGEKGKFSKLVSDAIMNGQVVLVAETRSQHETEIAQEAIKASLGNYKEDWT